MVWLAALGRVVGQQVGLEILKTAGREIGKRLGKTEPRPVADTSDLAGRVQVLERQLDERSREIASLAAAVEVFGDRFERFIGRFILLSAGSMVLAVVAVVFALLL